MVNVDESSKIPRSATLLARAATTHAQTTTLQIDANDVAPRRRSRSLRLRPRHELRLPPRTTSPPAPFAAPASQARAISLGSFGRFIVAGCFPCADDDATPRGARRPGRSSFPTTRRCCQPMGRRTSWLCWSLWGPPLVALATALTIFYSLYLPAVSRQHAPLYDTSGDKVEAHGGQILAHEGLFYWYGESRKELMVDGRPLGVSQLWANRGINCYVSRNLLEWDYSGLVFRNSSVLLPDRGPYVLERPKVLFNARTRLFVMWMHVDSLDYALRYAGVATSRSPLGPFEWLHALRPNGYDSFDLQLWREPEGVEAYLLRDTNAHRYTMVSRLTPNFTDVVDEPVVSTLRGPCEGMALFKDVPADGAYYLVCSYATWYYPNAMQLHRKLSKLDDDATKWEYLGDIGDGFFSRLSYNSQPTFIFPMVDSATGDLTPVYMGDNWNANGPGGVGNASYLWLPLHRATAAQSTKGRWWPGARPIPWRLPWRDRWLQQQVAEGVNLTQWLYL